MGEALLLRSLRPPTRSASSAIPRFLSGNRAVGTPRARSQTASAPSIGSVSSDAAPATDAHGTVGAQGMRGSQALLGLALLAPVPGVVAALSGASLPDVGAPILFGIAILGAAFLLAWAGELLQLD